MSPHTILFLRWLFYYVFTCALYHTQKWYKTASGEYITSSKITPIGAIKEGNKNTKGNMENKANK